MGSTSGSTHQVAAAPLREHTRHHREVTQLHTVRSHSLSPIPREKRGGESFRKKSSPHRKLVLDSFFSSGVAGRAGVMQYFPCCSATGEKSACSEGDQGSIPGLGTSPGEGRGYPLQYSGLENSMDYAVHGVAKSQTRLSDFHFRFHFLLGARGTSHTQGAGLQAAEAPNSACTVGVGGWIGLCS